MLRRVSRSFQRSLVNVTTPAFSTNLVTKQNIVVRRDASQPIYGTKFNFSTTPAPSTIDIPDASVVSESVESAESTEPGAAPEYENTEQYFPKDKALTIRQHVISSIEEDETACMLLQAVAMTDENPMSKLHKVEGILRSVGTSVLIELCTPGEDGSPAKLQVPYLGSERTAWDSFETAYKVLAVADETGTLQEAKIQEWCTILGLMYDTDEFIVRKASLTSESARELASSYRDYILSDEFYTLLQSNMDGIAIAQDRTNRNALAIEIYDRQRVLMQTVSKYLVNLYAQYGYTGDDGFMLMQKALNEHIQDAEVVAALAEAGAHAAFTAGIQQ